MGHEATLSWLFKRRHTSQSLANTRTSNALPSERVKLGAMIDTDKQGAVGGEIHLSGTIQRQVTVWALIHKHAPGAGLVDNKVQVSLGGSVPYRSLGCGLRSHRFRQSCQRHTDTSLQGYGGYLGVQSK
jgi:hypothetical protein